MKAAAHAPPAFSAPVKGHSSGPAVLNSIRLLSSLDTYSVSRNVSSGAAGRLGLMGTLMIALLTQPIVSLPAIYSSSPGSTMLFVPTKLPLCMSCSLMRPCVEGAVAAVLLLLCCAEDGTTCDGTAPGVLLALPISSTGGFRVQGAALSVGDMGDSHDCLCSWPDRQVLHSVSTCTCLLCRQHCSC